MMKNRLAAVLIAGAMALGLSACGTTAQHYDQYAQVCEDRQTGLRVADYQCNSGGYYHWYYFPPTIIAPSIGYHIPRGGTFHRPAHVTVIHQPAHVIPKKKSVHVTVPKQKPGSGSSVKRAPAKPPTSSGGGFGSGGSKSTGGGFRSSSGGSRRR